MERRPEPEPTVNETPRKTEQPFDFPEMPDFPSFPWEQEEKEAPAPRTTQYDSSPYDDKRVAYEVDEIDNDRWERDLTQSRKMLDEAAKTIEGNPIYQKRGETLEVVDLDDDNVTHVRIKGFKPQPSDVVQGMIWSQVFGPPRARSPHKTNRFSTLNRSRRS